MAEPTYTKVELELVAHYAISIRHITIPDVYTICVQGWPVSPLCLRLLVQNVGLPLAPHTKYSYIARWP